MKYHVEVTADADVSLPLFPFRLGKHPTKAGNGKSFKKRA